MSSRLIIALDFASADAALQFIAPLSPADCKLKVGFELFVAAGPTFVKQLVDKGFEVFLDLKFHDIPNTVAAACKSAAQLGVWMLNVHASGGTEMLVAAHEAVHSLARPPKLIAVTVLTSMDQAQLQSIGVNVEPVEQVVHLAGLAQRCGLDGVVCSAQEASRLKQAYGQAFLLVTPGIRLDDAISDDQKRIMTPQQAQQVGIDYIVMGRPITQAANPIAVIATVNQALAS